MNPNETPELECDFDMIGKDDRKLSLFEKKLAIEKYRTITKSPIDIMGYYYVDDQFFKDVKAAEEGDHDLITRYVASALNHYDSSQPASKNKLLMYWLKKAIDYKATDALAFAFVKLSDSGCLKKKMYDIAVFLKKNPSKKVPMAAPLAHTWLQTHKAPGTTAKKSTSKQTKARPDRIEKFENDTISLLAQNLTIEGFSSGSICYKDITMLEFTSNGFCMVLRIYNQNIGERIYICANNSDSDRLHDVLKDIEERLPDRESVEIIDNNNTTPDETTQFIASAFFDALNAKLTDTSDSQKEFDAVFEWLDLEKEDEFTGYLEANVDLSEKPEQDGSYYFKLKLTLDHEISDELPFADIDNTDAELSNMFDETIELGSVKIPSRFASQDHTNATWIATVFGDREEDIYRAIISAKINRSYTEFDWSAKLTYENAEQIDSHSVLLCFKVECTDPVPKEWDDDDFGEDDIKAMIIEDESEDLLDDSDESFDDETETIDTVTVPKAATDTIDAAKPVATVGYSAGTNKTADRNTTKPKDKKWVKIAFAIGVLLAIIAFIVSSIIKANSDEAVYVWKELYDGTIQINGINEGMSDKVVKHGVLIIPSEIDGKKVTSIGYDNHYNAFGNCDDITSVVIPDGVTDIKKQAFSSCNKLTSITLPDSIKNIGANAFAYCSSLKKINMPEYVETIDDYAFMECSGFTNLTIPDTVTHIGDGAFEKCSMLERVTIPGSVTYFGDRAFSSCPDLKTVKIEDGITSISNYAFFNCESLKNVTIPDSVTSINQEAFSNCKSLNSITIPDSVTSINQEAFSNCKILKSITIPGSVTKLGDRVFDGCVSIASMNIPDSVQSIGYSAFRNCESLTSINIPYKVKYLGDSLFEGCISLASIVIPDSITSIGVKAFYNCSSLTSVIIPNSVTVINDSTFEGCKSLASIAIPDSITSIGVKAFYNCASLESIIIPDSVTNIGNSAFSGCIKLASIKYRGAKSGWDRIKKGFSWNYQAPYNSIVYDYTDE